eukprot:Opistho-2@77026
MLQLEVLILKLVAIDRLAASSIAVGEVTTLDHEVLDDTVENGSLVAEALLASAEGDEVLNGLGDGGTVKANDNTTSGLASNRNVEENLVGDLRSLLLTTLGRCGLGTALRRGQRGDGEERKEGKENSSVRHCNQKTINSSRTDSRRLNRRRTGGRQHVQIVAATYCSHVLCVDT